MELILKRIAKKKDYTIGRLYVSGPSRTTPQPLPCREGSEMGTANEKPSASQTHSAPSLQGRAGGGSEPVYFCDTLEPTWRDVGWGRKGRKVAGRTAIPAGRYAVAVTWSPHLKEWLPLLLHVPLFEGIRIHAGNTAKDTRGCILVGENRKPGMVLDSRRTLSLLMKRLKERPEGEGIHITIMD